MMNLNAKSFHLLVWPILIIFFTYIHKRTGLKSINEDFGEQVLELRTEVEIDAYRNLLIDAGASNKFDEDKLISEFKNLELVDDPNKRYLFEKHPVWNRSSAISLHQFNVSIIGIVVASIVIGYVLIALFQR